MSIAPLILRTMLDDTIPTSNSDAINTQADPVQPPQEIAQEMPQEPPPPAGDSEKAEKYLNQLINLINQDKLAVTHTDLNKFNITSIENHYRMDLKEYEIEINHSKQPDSGQDFYIMLFNNIKKIENAEQICTTKIILAYTHLTQTQFEDFKEAADSSLERQRKAEEAKRFATAMNPIDDVLNNLGSSASVAEEDIEEKPEELTGADDENQDENQTEDLADFDDSPKASDFLSQPSQPQPTI